MRQFRVHRVNFFRPEPKEIKRMAYDENVCKLAVARSDFSIELWDMKGKPFLERVIPSATDNSIESVVWYKGRLFSFDLHGQIIEYDLNLLSPKYCYHASAGAIWCASANEEKGLLAVGTEDGTVCIFQITSDGIEFVKNLYKQERRIMCVAWNKSGDVIVAGSINCIKLWNLTTATSDTIIVGSKVQRKETIVWCIAVTSDMTIISGDSSGKTSFWDGKTGTLLSVSAAHKADVLTLCLNKDENIVYSSGVDPVIIMYVKSETAGSAGEKWLKSVQRIVHTHDVYSIQLTREFLVSGGVDTNLVFCKFPPKTVVKFSPFSQLSYCSLASEASLLLLRYHSELEVWKLGKTSASSGQDRERLSLSLSPVKAVSLQSKGGQQIICSAISSDGRWLAYSTASELKLFHLNMGSGVPYPQKVKSLPKSLSVAAHSLVFKPSQPHLIVSTPEGTIRILECDMISPKLLASSTDGQDSVGRKHLLAASKDFVACGDHNGNVTIYSSSDLKVYSQLPHYKFQPTALQFDKASENLVVAYSDRKVVEYNLKAKAFSEWSRQEFVTKEKLQMDSYYPILGVSFVPGENDILLHDETSLYIIDRSDKSQTSKKRTKQLDGSSSVVQENDSFRVTNKYKHLLSFLTMKDDLMVAIEVPPNFILNSLPPALHQKKFGV